MPIPAQNPPELNQNQNQTNDLGQLEPGKAETEFNPVSSKANSKHKNNWWLIGLVLAGLFVGVVAILGFFFYPKIIEKVFHSPLTTEVEPESAEVAFIDESYQTIKDNYWQVLSDEQLVNQFKLGLDLVYGPSPELKEKTPQALKTKITQLIKSQPNLDHQKLLPQVVDYVLQNLEPKGRSKLYTKQLTEKLNQKVANINPTKDYLKTLEISPEASDEAVASAFEKKAEEVKKTATSSAEKEKQLAELKQAYQVLADEKNRQRYAQTKIEPTIDGKLLDADTFYLKIKQFSPTTIEDMQHIIQTKLAGHRPHILILDLQDNIGGAIDYLPYLAGAFIGNNQYAYQFFHQGKTEDYLTKNTFLPELTQFKQVAVLINGQTQSSAEVLAATLKKYNYGVLVGETSKGWGTVERVFPLKHQLNHDQEYALFLVHRLTLRDDGLPIEGRGVEPDVKVSQPSWQQQLAEYGFSSKVIGFVRELLK